MARNKLVYRTALYQWMWCFCDIDIFHQPRIGMLKSKHTVAQHYWYNCRGEPLIVR